MRVSSSTQMPTQDDGYCLYTWIDLFGASPPDVEALGTVASPMKPTTPLVKALWPACGSQPAAQCAMNNVLQGVGTRCSIMDPGCRPGQPLVSGCGSCGHVTDGKLVLVGLPPGDYSVSVIDGGWAGKVTIPENNTSIVYTAVLQDAPLGSYWATTFFGY